MRPNKALAPLLVCGLLCACASQHEAKPPEPPTLKTLAAREVVIKPDQPVVATEQTAINAYRKFLEVAPQAPQRSEAMRRLGDLEMDTVDNRLAEGTASGVASDYRAAIQRYREFLKAYPKDPGNDRVLYQIARAQEQGGELEAALATLDDLVRQFPNTAVLDEVQFRRGELLFSTRDYVKAEQAYASVLKRDAHGTFQERALYMQGWSLFKQGRLEDALQSFFGVLDLKIAGRGTATELEQLPDLTRADRELVEDTFRVTSLCLSNLQGAETIPAYVTSDARRSYEFRVYQQLGELYLKQDRSKDAVDAFSAFAKRNPLHAQAPQLQARVIDIDQAAGFATLALEAKKDYVLRYGAESEFRRANPSAWQDAQPLVKTHLAELARYYHASAQKTKLSSDYQEAVRWYRAYLGAFPNDPEAAQNNFLLAELLFEDARFNQAAIEYEKTAYQYPPHAKSADAGYSALLSYAALEKRASSAELPALQRSSVDSALRFAQAFPGDTRTATVLTNAAEKLFALHDGERAAGVAWQVLALQPAPPAAQRRVAWTVIAHTAFDSSAFALAERAYGEVLALTPDKEPGRNELVERLAASVYKQGEKARADGDLRQAVRHFERVALVAPLSAVRASAQFDAAAALIALKDWDGAARTLEDFRQRFPKHPLQAEVGAKLALAYSENGRWAQAAGEYERLSDSSKDPKLAAAALWQAAELYEKGADKGGSRAQAAKAYERYLKLYPGSLESSIEARSRLAHIARLDGNAARELALMKEIFQADQSGGSARTSRTRYLGATAALALAAPVAESFRQVALVEPLAKQLKLKKAKMEDALKAYAVAANYGVADVTTAATFYTADLYREFGRAMLSSQRPKKLSKIELEQYNLMLEEQADPFAEKATELHELNARRAAEGIYDPWVKSSYAALKELRPLRYGKTERGEAVIDAIR